MFDPGLQRHHSSTRGLPSGPGLLFAGVVIRGRVLSFLHQLLLLSAHLIQTLVSFLPVHALVEVLELQLALPARPGLADPVGALDPLLLEGVAPRCALVGLLPALSQQPLVNVHSQPVLQIHKRHGCAVSVPRVLGDHSRQCHPVKRLVKSSSPVTAVLPALRVIACACVCPLCYQSVLVSALYSIGGPSPWIWKVGTEGAGTVVETRKWVRGCHGDQSCVRGYCAFSAQ